MERASVNAKLLDGQRLIVEGYACQIDGIDMVVHAAIIGETLSTSGWVVTEPKTGCCVTRTSLTTPEAAVELARTLVKHFGGKEALEAHIEKVTANE